MVFNENEKLLPKVMSIFTNSFNDLCKFKKKQTNNSDYFRRPLCNDLKTVEVSDKSIFILVQKNVHYNNHLNISVVISNVQWIKF